MPHPIRQSFYIFLLWLVMYWVMSFGAQARTFEKPELLNAVTQLVPPTAALQTSTAYLVDTTGTETIESIVQRPAQDFTLLQRPLSAGFTRNVHWLRLAIQPTAALPSHMQWLLEVRPAYHDDVRLYVPDTSSHTGFKVHTTGDLLPFINREIQHRFFVFPLDLPTGTQPLTVYLRVQSSSTHFVSLTLYERNAFNKASQGEYLALGLQLGALCAMLLYTLLHWRLLHQQYLCLFLGLLISIAVATFGISGLASQLLFPTQPAWANLFAPLGTCLFTFFGIWFYLDFFKVWQRYPWFGRLGTFTMALSALGTLSVFFDFYVEIAPLLMLSSVISMPFYLVIVWRSIGPRFFGGLWIAIAHSWFCVVMVVNQLTVMGAISSPAWINDWHYNSLVYLMLLMSGVVTHMREAENLRDLAVTQSQEAQLKAQVATQQREEKSKFLSLLAHDLKTPLATIDAAIQALGFSAAATADGANTQRYQRIRSAVKQLNTLLEDALRIARNEMQPAPVFANKEWVDLQQLSNALREHSCADGTSRITLDWQYDQGLYADRMLLRRALINLLDNALKYSPSEWPIDVQAHVQSHMGQAGLAFKVINAFTGLGNENCEMWFTPYTRGNNAQHSEGLGLGLYLVQSIAQAHAGHVWACIEPYSEAPTHHRLVMTLWLPIEKCSN